MLEKNNSWDNLMLSINSKNVSIIFIAVLSLTLASSASARSSHYSKHNYYKDNKRHYQPSRHAYGFGHRVSRLPRGYISLRHGGFNFFYSAGSYYQHRDRDYVVVRPPLGLGISILPAGYRSLHHRGRNYYFANNVYYRWNDFRRSYVVVDDSEVGLDLPTTQPVQEQFVYPKHGQNSAQTSEDRYQCYLWAVNQTGVEPAQIQASDSSNDIDAYQRANGACLEARGYSVK